MTVMTGGSAISRFDVLGKTGNHNDKSRRTQSLPAFTVFGGFFAAPLSVQRESGYRVLSFRSSFFAGA